MSDGADRREARRFTMSLPMRVLSPVAEARELGAETRDVSYRGLYFLADAKLKIGSEIDFVITLPEQVTQSSDVNIRCQGDRKSTRLNSSHSQISYAVFCLKKKKKQPGQGMIYS